ncbi:MAG: 30S ribosomal protein S20 [Ignavibacteria bacterium]|nr:30S ribosomal protein S20 [Ignavibacteria bacterium]
MPLRHKSAQKRARQIKKRTERNKKYKAKIRGVVKRVIAQKDKSAAENEFKKAVSTLDRAATKNIIHKNKASRIKSKLSKYLKTLSK